MTAVPQHMQALQNANQKRLALADFKRRVRNLPVRAAAELVIDTIECDHNDPVLGSLRVRQVLMCVPKMGEQKVVSCLTRAGVVYFDKRLRDLTERQRKAVCLQLLVWSAGYRS